MIDSSRIWPTSQSLLPPSLGSVSPQTVQKGGMRPLGRTKCLSCILQKELGKGAWDHADLREMREIETPPH